MYTYKVIEVPAGILNGKLKEDCEYERIINNYAKDGWRLHTFTPSPFISGQTLTTQIIFEKEVK